MPEPTPQLYLLSPLIDDPESFAPTLAQACTGGAIAAVLLRLAPADERSLVNQVKVLAPLVQEYGAAAVIAGPHEADLALIAARGGADGIHIEGAGLAEARSLRERLKGRILGAGALKSRHEAMSVGEAGVDYVMFGEPRSDGALPPLEAVAERAAWWAEIFETPCVAYAPTLDAIPRLTATGAEFVAAGTVVWNSSDPAAAVRAALDALAQGERR